MAVKKKSIESTLTFSSYKLKDELNFHISKDAKKSEFRDKWNKTHISLLWET